MMQPACEYACNCARLLGYLLQSLGACQSRMLPVAVLRAICTDCGAKLLKLNPAAVADTLTSTRAELEGDYWLLTTSCFHSYASVSDAACMCTAVVQFSKPAVLQLCEAGQLHNLLLWQGPACC